MKKTPMVILIITVICLLFIVYTEFQFYNSYSLISLFRPTLYDLKVDETGTSLKITLTIFLSNPTNLRLNVISIYLSIWVNQKKIELSNPADFLYLVLQPYSNKTIFIQRTIPNEQIPSTSEREWFIQATFYIKGIPFKDSMHFRAYGDFKK